MTPTNDNPPWQAVAREGERFLLAVPGADPHRLARVHDTETGQLTDPQPLQVWFKWAEWEDCTQQDYEAALRHNLENAKVTERRQQHDSLRGL